MPKLFGLVTHLMRWASWRPPRIGSVLDAYVSHRMVCPAHGEYEGADCPMCDFEVEYFEQTGKWP